MRIFNIFKTKYWVTANAGGVVIKCSGEQLRSVLDTLINHANQSPALKSWLYFKVVPKEYKQVVVERDYFRKKYEEMIGYHPMSKEVSVTPYAPTVHTEQNQSEVVKHGQNNTGRTSSYKAKKSKKGSDM